MSKPITPEEMKAWIDATWEKCQSEAWREPRQWVGLTEKEKRDARNSVSYSPLAMTMGEWTEAVQNATEAKLKEKNGITGESK